jgi:hypothetical protein
MKRTAALVGLGIILLTYSPASPALAHWAGIDDGDMLHNSYDIRVLSGRGTLSFALDNGCERPGLATAIRCPFWVAP